jgi:hypothetical protein
MPDYSEDVLTDPRIAHVSIDEFKQYLEQQGVANSEVQACSTKFALVALAEAKKVELESILTAGAKKHEAEEAQKKPDSQLAQAKKRVSNAVDSVGKLLKKKDGAKKGKGKKGKKESPKGGGAKKGGSKQGTDTTPRVASAETASNEAAVLAAYDTLPQAEAQQVIVALTGETNAAPAAAPAAMEPSSSVSPQKAKPPSVSPAAAARSASTAVEPLDRKLTFTIQLTTEGSSFPFTFSLRAPPT